MTQQKATCDDPTFNEPAMFDFLEKNEFVSNIRSWVAYVDVVDVNGYKCILHTFSSQAELSAVIGGGRVFE
jgi:hypothetical protein